MERLADTEEIQKIESRFINLISRTFLKGAVGVPGPQIFNSVKKAFSSKTYEIQLDKIIDEIYIASVDYADSKTEELGGSSPGSAQASRTEGKVTEGTNTADLQARRAAAKNKPLPITEEAIKQTKALTGDAAESVTRWLKDNDLYTQHPDQLARQVKDLWDGERYKARRFAVTFTADLAENTAIHRYNDLGITYLQFYAEIDEKTTPQCRQFHGTIIKANSRDAQRYRPPLHFHCRSCLIPATSKTLENEDLLIENRDFTQHYDQNFKPLKMRTDIEQVNSVLDDIGKFNEKYRIDQFILDEDIQLRLMKLNLSVVTEKPNPTLKKWLEPEKVKTPKPKYPTGHEIRGNIPKVQETYTKKLDDLRAEIKRVEDQSYKDWLEYQDLNAKLRDPETFFPDKDDLQKAKDRFFDLEMKTLENDEKGLALRKAQKPLLDEQLQKTRELLYINDGTPRTDLFRKPDDYITYGREFKPETVKKINEAQDFLNKVTTQEIRDKIPNMQVWETRDRSWTANDHIIRFDERAGPSELIHEVGHNIENSNEAIRKSTYGFLEKRTAGEEAKTLNEILGTTRYRPNEIAKKDNFISPYMGKLYADKQTEIMSAGIQYLHEDPAKLADKDPEMFDLIVDLLRGGVQI